MKVRLRSADKNAIDIPKSIAFVELLNDVGEVMAVITPTNKTTGTIDVFDAREIDKAKRYSDFFKVSFVNKINVLNPNTRELRGS